MGFNWQFVSACTVKTKKCLKPLWQVSDKTLICLWLVDLILTKLQWLSLWMEFSMSTKQSSNIFKTYKDKAKFILLRMLLK